MYYWHLYLDINGSDIPCTRHMVPHSAVLLVITSDRDLMICFNYHINSERRDIEHKQETEQHSDLMICFNYHIDSERRDIEHKHETEQHSDLICFNHHINSERRDIEHKQETTLKLQMEPMKAYKSSHPMNTRLL